MPLTKKKGAVFAIYADSPVSGPEPRASTSAAAAAAAGGGSPTKRPARKPLAAVQRAQPGRPPSAAGPLKPALASKPALATLPLSSKPASALGKAPAAGRVADDCAPTKARPTTATARPRADASAAPLPKRGPSPLDTPAKRTRPVEASAPPAAPAPSASPSVLDSPAARTRSRTGPLPAPTLSPLETSRSTPRRRPAANDENADPFGGAPARAAAGAQRRTPKSSKPGLKGATVRAEGPLADVSEAYGASGMEPDGFRDVVVAR